MKYPQILSTIYSRDGKSSNFTLDRVREAAAGIGNPQDRFRALHVAGSNGKGSVAKMVVEVLGRSGFKTALFTSPHVHRYTERIRIGGREIPKKEVIRRFNRIEQARLEGKIPWITFFEITTLIAFDWFADMKVDLAVVEVGLGGRLDATNICHSIVDVITTIGIEHTKVLGSTIRQIAGEKAGIIKGPAPVICGKLPTAALKRISRRASAKRADLKRLGKDFIVRENGDGTFDYRGSRLRLDGLRNSLRGRHQVRNAAVCCAALEELMDLGYAVKPRMIAPALREVTWEGRLETLSKKPEVIIDCAHNVPAVKALVKELDGRKYHLVFGALGDKPIEKMFGMLRPFTRRAYVSSPDVHRSISPREIGARCGARAYDSVSAAMDAAVRDARKSGLPVLVTGSVFVVAEAREHYLKLENVDPPIAS
ncbi:MAG: folylpolyglutamate synthase/dihydrofolate synthase family protein [Pseudomonadota bacterium]